MEEQIEIDKVCDKLNEDKWIPFFNGKLGILHGFPIRAKAIVDVDNKAVDVEFYRVFEDGSPRVKIAEMLVTYRVWFGRWVRVKVI